VVSNSVVPRSVCWPLTSRGLRPLAATRRVRVPAGGLSRAGRRQLRRRPLRLVRLGLRPDLHPGLALDMPPRSGRRCATRRAGPPACQGLAHRPLPLTRRVRPANAVAKRRHAMRAARQGLRRHGGYAGRHDAGANPGGRARKEGPSGTRRSRRRRLVAEQARDASRGESRIDKKEHEELLSAIKKSYDDKTDVRYAASRGRIDAIPARRDPFETRTVLAQLLDYVSNPGELPPFRTGALRV